MEAHIEYLILRQLAGPDYVERHKCEVPPALVTPVAVLAHLYVTEIVPARATILPQITCPLCTLPATRFAQTLLSLTAPGHLSLLAILVPHCGAQPCATLAHLLRRFAWADVKMRTKKGALGRVNVCGSCGVIPAEHRSQICSTCKDTSYCSAACAKLAWKAGHKAICEPPLGAMPSEINVVALVGDKTLRMTYDDLVAPLSLPEARLYGEKKERSELMELWLHYAASTAQVGALLSLPHHAPRIVSFST